MSVKTKILEEQKTSVKSVEDLVKATGCKPGIVKGQLTRLIKEGEVEKTAEGEYKLNDYIVLLSDLSVENGESLINFCNSYVLFRKGSYYGRVYFK
ncbi:MAG: hypothetical protein QW424_00225 [Candidatus Bathyarchaeia archaeon]